MHSASGEMAITIDKRQSVAKSDNGLNTKVSF